MDEIPKAYEPQKVEDDIYRRWEASGFFNPDRLEKRTENREQSWRRRILGYRKRGGKPFVIMLPPPNATGTLHVGHAMYTIQDVMVRFERMRGKAALWLPGTDHAAIATHAKVEHIVQSEGSSRFELGREKFVERILSYIEKSRGRINLQLRKMGFSLDWSREAYTFDEPRNRVVRVMFQKMYEDGLIYRGNRIVHWCPHCRSTLSDDEVEYREERTPFYYFKYGPVVIGTARPETKFLDKTIVVHPDDARYKDLQDKKFEIEWIDGKITSNVIADEVVDPTFGTGAMTITPAHSFDDFELAKKHKLPIVQIIDEEGNFTDAAGEFAGRNARTSRNEIVKRLENKGLLDHIDEEYVHNLSICYRCGTPLEPLVSKQWFVDVVKPFQFRPSSRHPITGIRAGQEITLKELMGQVVRTKQIKIIPERFEKIYFHWIDNLRDWCISRQIWFGHQIPVWYHDTCQEVDETGESCASKPAIVGEFKKDKAGLIWCPYCKNGYDSSDHFSQEQDTLDTWFSSGTWTFSTLGWPEVTSDLQRFHPTDVLETGYDILFFWVARMILMTCYGLGEIPFHTVYLHGLVRDEQGRKMSKSLENTIDPLDVAEKYGTDAVRLSLVLGTGPGQDKNLGEEKIAGFRNFTNKLWNIARYVLMVTERTENREQSTEPMTLADRWILGELDRVTEQVTQKLVHYEFSPAGELLRDFTWGSLADWYIEIVKQQLTTDNLQFTTAAILRHCLERVLRLWHPFMPFVTERIWELAGHQDLLMVADWPETAGAPDQAAQEQFSVLREIVSAVRNIRATYGIESGKKTAITIAAGADAQWLKQETEVIARLARAGAVNISEEAAKPPQSAGALVGAIRVWVELAGVIDLDKERDRLKKWIEETRGYKNTIRDKLANQGFVEGAPQTVVAAEREKLAAAGAKLKALEEQLQSLG